MNHNPFVRYASALTFVGLLAVAMPHQAGAAPILDQTCCGGASNLSSFLDVLTRAQTFTVGLTGSLTSADVLLSLGESSGSLQFDIVPGFGNGTALASLAAPLASYTFNWSAAAPSPIYYNLDFADFAVTAGDFLAIVMRPLPASISGSWVGATQNPYSGGEALTTTFPAPGTFTNDIFGSSDYGFRTYVEAAVVPEPGTFTLMGGALGAMLIRRYRRRAGTANASAFSKPTTIL